MHPTSFYIGMHTGSLNSGPGFLRSEDLHCGFQSRLARSKELPPGKGKSNAAPWPFFIHHRTDSLNTQV